MAFGGRGTEYLLMVGLVIIIAGAVILTIYSPNTRRPAKMQFQCGKCGHLFDPPVLRTRVPGASGPQAMQVPVMDCPNKACQAKKSCLPMTRCSKCGKYYVNEVTKWRVDRQAGKQVSPKKPNNICPHCKTDQQQYGAQQRR